MTGILPIKKYGEHSALNLKVYIQADFDGLHDKVTRMIAGEKVEVNTAKFQNDMTTFATADDILTLLVHLG